jgi:hypothetical protein
MTRKDEVIINTMSRVFRNKSDAVSTLKHRVLAMVSMVSIHAATKTRHNETFKYAEVLDLEKLKDTVFCTSRKRSTASKRKAT